MDVENNSVEPVKVDPSSDQVSESGISDRALFSNSSGIISDLGQQKQKPSQVLVNPLTGEVLPNINTYQQKKNLAQGMMDLALVSANANQLRYVIESFTRHPYYYFSLIFISVSLVIQVAVGVGLIMNSRYDVNDKREICKADKINNMVTIGIFLITLVNVLISAFGVAPQVN